MTKNNLTAFLCENITAVIREHPKRLITMKDISDSLKRKFGDEEIIFEPRRVGHYVRMMGYSPIRLSNGYTIVKNN